MLLILAACQGTVQPEIIEAPYAPDSGSLAVRCGMLIDGIADAPIADRLVVIHDGRIVSVVPGDSEVPPGMPRLELADHTCLPGLINTHTHLAVRPEDSSEMDIYYRRTMAATIDMAIENAGATLHSGFTTARNVGAYFPEAIYALRDKIDAGEVAGPRVRTAGPYLTIPGGGGDLVIPGHDESEIPAGGRLGVARGAEQFREKAQQAIDEGADFLKVIASGAVFAFGGVPGAPEMTEEEIAAVVEVGHAAGIKVTAHVHSAQSGKDAARAGVDSIEHASLLDDEAIEMAAENGIVLSMDVYNGTYTDTVGREQGYPEEFLQKNFDTTEAQRVVFEKAYARGIRILYGTDAGVLPHDMGGWQFGIMVERGMAPMDAIKSATSTAADHMGMQSDIGALERGRFGDLIAVRSDPLKDIDAMKDVVVVIKGGLLFKLGPGT